VAVLRIPPAPRGRPCLAAAYATPRLAKHAESSWLSTWTPTDTQGTHVKLHEGAPQGLLAVDDDGRGYAVVYPGDLSAYWLYRLAPDTEPEPVALPHVGSVGWLDLDPAGNPWFLVGDQLHRREGERWLAEALTASEPIDGLYGVRQGAPWAVRRNAAIAMRTSDGRWHDVMPLRNQLVGAAYVKVVSATDMFVSVGSPPKQALYTTRPVAKSRRCPARR
jgi:hypothetical protein